jgi:hypothetical protein
MVIFPPFGTTAQGGNSPTAGMSTGGKKPDIPVIILLFVSVPNIIFLVAEPHVVAETQTNPTPVFLSDRNVVCYDLILCN